MSDYQPFGLGLELSKEQQESILKKDLRNLLASYRDEADVFVELIQNAFDAIQSKKYSKNSKGSLDVIIGRQKRDQQYIAVIDNGIGMDKKLAYLMTKPGISVEKERGVTIGHKGVGASFIFAASEKASIYTVKDGKSTEWTMTNAWSWVKNENEPLPSLSEKAIFPKYIVENDLLPKSSGTCVCYYLHKEKSPKNLNYLVKNAADPEGFSSEIHNWAALLCSKTSLGVIEPKHAFEGTVRIHLDRGNGEDYFVEYRLGSYPGSAQSPILGYPYPYKVAKHGVNLKDIENLDASKKRKHLRQHELIYRRWYRKEILTLSGSNKFTDEEEDLIEEHFQFIDVTFCYETDILTKLNETLGSKLGSNNIIQAGIKLAVDGVPQGRVVGFVLKRYEGYSKQAHALMSFRDMELDTGRKIPTDEVFGSVIEKIGRRVMTAMAENRKYLKFKDRIKPNKKLSDWKIDTKNRQESSRLEEIFRLNGFSPPLLVDPDSENDVILAFGGFISSNLIMGYQVHALSGWNTYDGLVTIDTSSSELTNIDDQLSIRNKRQAKEFGGEFKVLEFKLYFDDIINDFENHSKSPEDVSLIVCWKINNFESSIGRVLHTYHSRSGKRSLYAQTHEWKDNNRDTVIPIISLYDLVLNLHFVHDEVSPGGVEFEELDHKNSKRIV